MTKIINLNEYKKAHGIAPPRSPYYTLKATKEEIKQAVERASEQMKIPFDYRGLPPYAVMIGYKNKKTGDVKLLKELHVFSDREMFRKSAGIKNHYVLALIQKAQ